MSKTIPTLLICLFTLGACTSPDGPLSRREARLRTAAGDGVDYCSELGFHGDGVCDDWCLTVDSDCPVDGPPTCGGIAGLVCPPDMVCLDDPSDTCDPTMGGADCIGLCVYVDTTGCDDAMVCPEGSICIDDPSDACDPATGQACPTVCSEPEPPGTCSDGVACPPDMTCVSDLCVYVDRGACDPTMTQECADGGVCVDDPSDECDPSTGMDCPGVCEAPPADCRTTGCGADEYCDICWVGYSCIPNGAVC